MKNDGNDTGSDQKANHFICCRSSPLDRFSRAIIAATPTRMSEIKLRLVVVLKTAYHQDGKPPRMENARTLQDNTGCIPFSWGQAPAWNGKIPQVWLSLVDVLFIFGQEHRYLHDQLAGTWVINE